MFKHKTFLRLFAKIMLMHLCIFKIISNKLNQMKWKNQHNMVFIMYTQSINVWEQLLFKIYPNNQRLETTNITNPLLRKEKKAMEQTKKIILGTLMTWITTHYIHFRMLTSDAVGYPLYSVEIRWIVICFGHSTSQFNQSTTHQLNNLLP